MFSDFSKLSFPKTIFFVMCNDQSLFFSTCLANVFTDIFLIEKELKRRKNGGKRQQKIQKKNNKQQKTNF